MVILFCDSITVLIESLYNKHDKFRRDFPAALLNLLTQRWTESKFSKFCLLSSRNQQSFVQKQKIIMANESQILFLKVSCHRKPNKIKETLNNYAKSIGKVSQIGIINVKTVHEGNLYIKKNHFHYNILTKFSWCNLKFLVHKSPFHLRRDDILVWYFDVSNSWL